MSDSIRDTSGSAAGLRHGRSGETVGFPYYLTGEEAADAVLGGTPIVHLDLTFAGEHGPSDHVRTDARSGFIYVGTETDSHVVVLEKITGGRSSSDPKVADEAQAAIQAHYGEGRHLTSRHAAAAARALPVGNFPMAGAWNINP